MNTLIEDEISSIKRQPNGCEFSVTDSFKHCLVEILLDSINVLCKDLIYFSKHAGREVIEPQDLYLFCRRNVSLQNHLIEFEHKSCESKDDVVMDENIVGMNTIYEQISHDTIRNEIFRSVRNEQHKCITIKFDQHFQAHDEVKYEYVFKGSINNLIKSITNNSQVVMIPLGHRFYLEKELMFCCYHQRKIVQISKYFPIIKLKQLLMQQQRKNRNLKFQTSYFNDGLY